MLSRLNPHRVFYGWWIVAAAFVIALYVGGAIFYGITALFEPIVSELGWSYTEISLAVSLRGLEAGIFAPFIGILVDRWGPRKIILIGALFAIAGLLLLGETETLFMFYSSFFLMAIGMSACTSTVLMTAVANWFRRKIGTANGIVASGFGFSGILVPIIVRMISLYDWHMTMNILAFGMLIIVLPLALVFRHRPEDYGHLLDGQREDRPERPTTSNLPPVTDVEVGVIRALKSGTFWRLALPFMYHMMVVNAAVVHVMPYLGSVGITRSFASFIATGIPLASILGRFGFGWIGDRHDRKMTAAVSVVMIGAGLLFFGFTTLANSWLLFPFLILFGSGYGGLTTLRAALGREYFGRSRFGSIFGLMLGIGSIGAIIGPTAAGWAYDTWGDYRGIWIIMSGLAVLAFFSVLTVKPVDRATAIS